MSLCTDLPWSVSAGFCCHSHDMYVIGCQPVTNQQHTMATKACCQLVALGRLPSQAAVFAKQACSTHCTAVWMQ